MSKFVQLRLSNRGYRARTPPHLAAGPVLHLLLHLFLQHFSLRSIFFMKPLTSALCTENSSLHFKVLTCKTQEGKKFLYHLYSFRTYGCPEFLLRMRWRLRWNMLPTQVAHVCLCAGLSPTRRSYWPTHTSSRAVGQKHRM